MTFVSNLVQKVKIVRENLPIFSFFLRGAAIGQEWKITNLL